MAFLWRSLGLGALLLVASPDGDGPRPAVRWWWRRSVHWLCTGEAAPLPAAQVVSKQAARVMWSQSTGQGDICQLRIQRSRFVVLEHRPGRSGLEMWWEQGRLHVQWPIGSMLCVSAYSNLPQQLAIGTWHLRTDLGSVVDPNGRLVRTSADGKSYVLVAAEGLFPPRSEFGLQAILPGGTSDAWRIQVL